MFLKHGSRHMIAHRAGQRPRYDLSFLFPIGQQDYLFRFHNLSNSLGNSLRQRQIPTPKILFLYAFCDVAELCPMRTQGKIHTLLVETEVAIHPDSQHLHADGAIPADEIILP